jgi:hypothetical protein
MYNQWMPAAKDSLVMEGFEPHNPNMRRYRANQAGGEAWRGP